MLSILSRILAFLGPAENSVKGIINLDELKRVVGTSLVSGLIATAIGVVLAVQSDLPNIVNAAVLGLPVVGGAITTGLAALLDYLRRRQHGADIKA